MRQNASIFYLLRKWHFSDTPLYSLSMMLFFWAIFDGILGYLVPLVVTQAGMSKTEMGIIFGSSSIFGALLDFVLSKYLSNTHFRKLFFLMFGICILYPLILWQAKTVPVFLLAMAMWGFYFDIQNFGTFDFVGRRKDQDIHAENFGIIFIFKSLGYLLAPIIAGLLITTVVGWEPFLFAGIVLALSFSFFIFLLVTQNKSPISSISLSERAIKPINALRELSLWRSIGKIIFPVLILTMLLNILDAFFWTIGPLLSESFVSIHPFNGFFLAAYELPALMGGWIVGKVAKKYGKKRTAFLSFLLGSILLATLFVFANPVAIMGIIFISSFFISLSWPSIDGAYADYISESTMHEKEIEGLEDFATNIGYIIGPMAAGILADTFGNLQAFSFLGVMGIICSILLLRFTPKQIKVLVPQA